jgi:glutamate-5-semialdehyde dehydrogenase
LREIAELEDPVGATTRAWDRPNGLEISKVRLPLGVIMMIYESRPNVTMDAAALCIRSGNAVVFRGGSEAMHTNRVLATIVQQALTDAGLPEKAVQLVPTQEREAIDILLTLDQSIDLVIPRGGENLIRRVVERSRIPVVQHYKGICHVYVDAAADLDKASEIAFNAKVSRPGVCNAMETLLVDKQIAETFIPEIAQRYAEYNVEIRGCETTCSISEKTKPARDEDWDTEFLDLIIAIRVVDGLDEAIAHIDQHGSNHTASVVTENPQVAERFLNSIDASCVMVNASTRFNDGGELGLGAEMGISTTRIHAYGPMGVEALTAEKYVVRGTGQVRK